MKEIDKFANNEMDENHEKKYLESLYEKHYDQKLKSSYSEKLKEDYKVLRSSAVPKSNSSFTLKYILLGASGIAAVLVFVLFALPALQKGTNLNAKEFAQSLIVIEDIDVKRGQQIDSKLQLDIIEAYNSGGYNKALELYNQLSNLTNEDKYFKGRLLLFQHDYKEAIIAFEQIEGRDTFNYNMELKYWLGVAYASIGNNDSARPLLTEIAKSSWKTKEAQGILDKMK